MDTFLTTDAVIKLTGHRRKTKQIEALRTMGVPFWINALESRSSLSPQPKGVKRNRARKHG